MVIDSHQHFWKYDPLKLPWITEEMQVLKRDFLPEDLSPILRDTGVAGCVAVQAAMTEEETNFLLHCAADHPFVRGVVGWVDLRDPEVEGRLEFYSQYPHLKGIRHIVQDEPDDNFLLRPDFQNGIGQLSQFNLTYDILVYPRQLQAAVSLARRFPAQRFVLDHLGKPQVSDGPDPDWARAIRELGQLQNVFCKLSGMVTETNNFRWQKEDFYPFLDQVVEAFGTRRLLFGSDWPVCLLAGSYSGVRDIVDSYLATFSEDEKSSIMGKNAIRFYDL